MENDEIIAGFIIERDNANTVEEYNMLSMKIDKQLLSEKQFRTLKRKKR